MFFSPSSGNLHNLDLLRARTTERLLETGIFLRYRRCLSERMSLTLMMKPPCMLLYHQSCLNRNEVSHSPWVRDRLQNSKRWPASKHRGDEANGMLRDGDGCSRRAGVGCARRGNQTKTPWTLSGSVQSTRMWICPSKKPRNPRSQVQFLRVGSRWTSQSQPIHQRRRRPTLDH